MAAPLVAPDPLTATDVVPPGEPEIATIAARAPTAVGRKATSMPHVAEGARVAFWHRLRVMMKSVGFAPVMVTKSAPVAEPPTFDTVIDCDGLIDPSRNASGPKLICGGDTASAAGEVGAPPAPLSAATKLPPGVADAVRDAERGPVAAGANRTVTRQALSGGSPGPAHPLFTIEKSPALRPDMATVTAPDKVPPTFLITNSWVALAPI